MDDDDEGYMHEENEFTMMLDCNLFTVIKLTINGTGVSRPNKLLLRLVRLKFDMIRIVTKYRRTKYNFKHNLCLSIAWLNCLQLT